MSVADILSAQTWSAIAAVFAALAAWLAYTHQRHAHQATNAPYLLLSTIEATPTGEVWEITANEVRNFGPGIARNVCVVIFGPGTSGREHLGGGTRVVHMLGAGESGEVAAHAACRVPEHHEGRFGHRHFVATVLAWDLAGRRHKFVHTIFVSQILSSPLAVPLSAKVGSVRHSSQSVRSLKLKKRLLGLFGRPLADPDLSP